MTFDDNFLINLLWNFWPKYSDTICGHTMVNRFYFLLHYSEVYK